jgi:hypothetical protein
VLAIARGLDIPAELPPAAVPVVAQRTLDVTTDPTQACAGMLDKVRDQYVGERPVGLLVDEHPGRLRQHLRAGLLGQLELVAVASSDSARMQHR